MKTQIDTFETTEQFLQRGGQITLLQPQVLRRKFPRTFTGSKYQ